MNPFGASYEAIHEAYQDWSIAHAAWKRTQEEFAQIQARQEKRQQEEEARRVWQADPRSRGAQRVAELLRQPELGGRYGWVEYRASQLQDWQRLEHGAAKLGRIHQVTQEYLDGRELSQAAQDQMGYDLAQPQRLRVYEQQMEL